MHLPEQGVGVRSDPIALVLLHDEPTKLEASPRCAAVDVVSLQSLEGKAQRRPQVEKTGSLVPGLEHYASVLLEAAKRRSCGGIFVPAVEGSVSFHNKIS